MKRPSVEWYVAVYAWRHIQGALKGLSAGPSSGIVDAPGTTTPSPVKGAALAARGGEEDAAAAPATSLEEDEKLVEKLVAIIQNPKQFKIPTWFLNRQKDYKTGKYSQAFANTLHTTLRSDLERLKKIRAHRGLRHYWCIRVRGQHTKSTGRRGKTMAATKK